MNRKLLLILLVLFLPSAPNLLAQTVITGGVNGTVTDPTGAVIAEARVTLKNASTNQEQAVRTTGDGLYQFSFLP